MGHNKYTGFEAQKEAADNGLPVEGERTSQIPIHNMHTNHGELLKGFWRLGRGYVASVDRDTQ